MQLAHHRLNQKRQILQKQRPGDASGVRHRNLGRTQSYVKPYLPTDCLTVAPQGSDCLFQPIAEDEPSADNSLMFHQNSNHLKIEVCYIRIREVLNRNKKDKCEISQFRSRHPPP